MTEQEAIEIIWERHMDCEDYFSQYDSYPDGYDFELDQAILIAAQALEEIQQYRKIGTVEECREAVEKQKPKVGIVTAGKSYPIMCPSCEHKMDFAYHHCIFCGQNLIYLQKEKGKGDG